ncbi:MAG: Gfo/Idh/MocA family oxidoreductase [Clostridiales bacterium]|nr:Gfo/Idh/MocA family oxidoreductase [Clostridiales bacterium]
MKHALKVGIIGLGERGYSTLSGVLCDMDSICITYVCDTFEDRALRGQQIVTEKKGNTPKYTTDYRVLIEDPDVEVVVIASAWENHIPAAIAAMQAGKYVGCEVGGAYSIDDCWKLVHTYEETGRHCMMLENCCFGRDELMVLRMVREGLFGKVAACEGGYHHDLRYEITHGVENRHYRLRNYKNRCCENYPTHELGPIAKVLNINRGNRMLSLTSMSSGAWGLNTYAQNQENVNADLQTARFAQGDIIKTNILCAGGELITLTLDTSLPRHYSRGFTVRGTKGSYTELTKAIFLDSLGESGNGLYNNLDQYRQDWEHPIWQKYLEEGVKGGHDGMDWLVYSAFFEGILNDRQPVIDTYDMASWMAITPLSERSIMQGGQPMDIPDFTRGQWLCRTDSNQGPYSLDL